MTEFLDKHQEYIEGIEQKIRVQKQHRTQLILLTIAFFLWLFMITYGRRWFTG